MHAHTVDEDGRAGGGHDDVVRGGGHAHAEDDAADHREEQGDEQVAAGELDHIGDQLAAETSHRDAHGDDAGDAAGDADGQAVLAAVFKAVDELARGHAVVLIDDTDHDGNDGAVDGALGHGLTGDDHPGQDDQGQEQIDFRQQELPLGQFLTLEADEAELLRLEVDAEEDAEEVEERRQDRTDDDVGILIAGHFRHDERRGAHDGGHDLAAGGGRSLDRAGKLGGIAGLLHHRDGHGTGGNGVADGGTGDHAAQGGGDDRDLRGTAGRPADQRVRTVDEEVGDTGRLKERAEQQEQRNVGRADGDRGADDAVGGIEDVVDHQVQAHAAADEGVEHEAARHDQNGKAHRAAAALREHQRADDAKDDLGLADGDAHRHNPLEVGNIVEIGNTARDSEQDIIPRHGVGLYIALLHGVDKECEQDHKADEQAAADLAAPGGPQVHVDHKEHKGGQHIAQDQLGRALPDTGVGLAVILFHDRVNVFHRTDFNVYAFNDDLFVQDFLFSVSHWCFSPPFYW